MLFTNSCYRSLDVVDFVIGIVGMNDRIVVIVVFTVGMHTCIVVIVVNIVTLVWQRNTVLTKSSYYLSTECIIIIFL